MGYAAGGSAAAAAATAIANAIKASGTIVKVDTKNFMKILEHTEKPLVVRAETGIFTKKFQYLTSYKGLAFYTKTEKELSLGGNVELILAEKIWIPG
ncbi:hypothetical protein GF312_14460 [Candidatus Poribacteria bacterium]|nr:hypothetical protein [Candidatus Poribacteria bacterium]